MGAKYVFNPLTGNFDTTDVVAFNGEVDLGTAAAPSIFFTGDPNTGIYSPGADQLAISTNGTGRLFVDSNGKVAIGTNSPAQALGIAGLNGTPGNFTGIAFQAGGSEACYLRAVSQDSSNFALSFGTFNFGLSEKVRLTSDGRLGLGTSSPAALMHLSSATGSASPTPTELRIATTTSASDWSTTDPWGRISFYSADNSQLGPKIQASIDVNASDTFGGTSDLSIKIAPTDSATPVEAFNIDNRRSVAINTQTGYPPLVISNDTTPRFYIDSSGRVGIGTTSPGASLHVVGDVFSTTAFRVGSSTSSLSGQVVNESDTSKSITLAADPGNAGAGTFLGFAVDGSERARIDSSGRLLVGTSSARSNFDGNTATPLFQIEGVTAATSSASIVRSANDSIGSTFNLGKTRGAAVGGNTVVSSGDQIGIVSFQAADGTNLIDAASIQAAVDGTPGANDMPGRLVFSTTADGASSPTERMRITSTGATLIGSTGVSDGERLKVESSGAGNSTAYFVYASSDDRPVVMSYHAGSTGATSRKHYEFRNSAGAEVGSIAATGTATSYNTSSDYRLKENIVALSGAIDRVNQLQVHRFNFISDPDTTVDGFLAHEAQAVVPECVTGEKDAVDENGNPVYQGIDQSKLVPLLTAALQEAMERIEVLEAKFATLESA
jgi:hypothetical protein